MDKEELIKEIRADMRNLKNQWVFKRYDTETFFIETKRFNNWFQIFRIQTQEGNIINCPCAMEMKQRDVITQIQNSIKDF